MVKTFLFYVNVSALTLSDFELPTPHIAHFYLLLHHCTFYSLIFLLFLFSQKKCQNQKKVVTISMFCLCIVQL